LQWRGTLPHRPGRAKLRTLAALALERSARGRHKQRAGQVAEWLKAHAWKVCIRETVSRVRIPPCPPFYLAHVIDFIDLYQGFQMANPNNHPNEGELARPT
jgi:hypothetical protein